MDYVGFGFKNFKGIQDLYLGLAPGAVTTLIGLNESGKTTILEAIFCFSYGAENLDAIDPSMKSLRDPERWIPISRRGNFNETIEIRADVVLSEDDVAALSEHLKSEFDLSLGTVNRKIEIAELYRFENSRHVPSKMKRTWTLDLAGTVGRQKKARPFDSKTPEWQAAVKFLASCLPRIWYFPNFLFELPDRFALEKVSAEQPGEEGDKNAFYRLTFERILDQLGSDADLDTHVVARIKSQEKADERNLMSLLLDMGRNMTDMVFGGWNRIFGKAPSEQSVELKADIDPDGSAFLELKIKGPDGYYDLSERSLGFRWFFMFLLMTSYRGLGSDGRGTVFLLDEPASNLHSSAQAELLKSFENLSATAQLIYTTHSHHLINLRWLDSAFVVKNEALGDFTFEQYMTQRATAHTSISAARYRQFVSDNPSKTSYFQPVLDLLDYRPSDLEPVPNVVLVEGKSDFYFLRYTTEVIGLTPVPKLVPGGGAGSLEPLIRLHIGWGKGFVILLDDDEEGRKQKARYMDEFGPLVEQCCLTLKDLGMADTSEIEDFVSEADREALINAVFPPGGSQPPAPKKALLQAVVELYARREKVKLSAATRKSVAAVLKALDGKLKAQS
jgi:predicted ATP-dependent endonuclease of OLD family